MGIFLGNLTIPSGAQPSNVISGRVLRTVGSVSITAPATLTGVVTVQVPDGIGASPTFTTLQDPPGTDITLVASRTIIITPVPAHGIRVNSGVNEGAERVFPMSGEEKAHQ